MGRYHRLALQIAQDEIRSRCAVIKPKIEEYVHAEKSGDTAQAREAYPDVWLHLQGCSDCRLTYEGLRAAGTDE